MSRSYKKYYILLTACLFLNLFMWRYSHTQFPVWPNVPSPPSERAVKFSFLDDTTLAYRVWAMALQNFGNTGGNYEALKNYNYQYLAEWFDLMDKLDPTSDFMPLMAAYYFGATQEPKTQLPYVIPYLEKVGIRPVGDKWRWLVYSIYLARHRMQDIEEALRLSKVLSASYRPGMPGFTKQTEALITRDMGDRQAAYGIMKAILATDAKNMHPNEVNFMVEYICTKILTPEQAPHDPLCAENPTQPMEKSAE